MKFPCPLPAALVQPTLESCPFRIDQVVRMAFQIRQTTAPFPTAASIKLKENWEEFVAATDATKMVFSPLFAGFTIPSSEAVTTGGNDNSTIGGIREYFGEQSVTAAGQFKNIAPVTKRGLKALTPYSLLNAVGMSNLTIFFFNKDNVGYAYNHSPDLTFFGNQVFNFRVGDRGSEGLNAPDIIPFSIDLAEGWDDYLTPFIPTDFNALLDW